MIKIENLNKSYNGSLVINNISYNFKENSYIAIMGPSGSGKSTFLNLISGLETADSGTIIIQGKDMTKMKEPKLTRFRREHIGYIFQDYNLIDYLTVYKNVTLPMKIMGLHKKKKEVLKILEDLNILEHAYKLPEKLSGGQKQRVAIARSIIGKNEIVFADEPTGALDIFTRDKILDVFSSIHKTYKKLFLIVTHDPTVAAQADETIFLLNGEIVNSTKNSDPKKIASILVGLERECGNE